MFGKGCPTEREDFAPGRGMGYRCSRTTAQKRRFSILFQVLKKTITNLDLWWRYRDLKARIGYK